MLNLNVGANLTHVASDGCTSFGRARVELERDVSSTSNG